MPLRLERACRCGFTWPILARGRGAGTSGGGPARVSRRSERDVAEFPEKVHYKAAEVCRYTDTQPYVLRFWESEFPHLAPEKNRSGQRVYRRKDIELVLKIKKLLYEEEYTIAGARKRLDEEEDVGPPAERRAGRSEGPRTGREVLEDLVGGDPVDRSIYAPAAQEQETQIEIETLRRRLEEAEARYQESESALTQARQACQELRERQTRVADRLESLMQSLSSSGRKEASKPRTRPPAARQAKPAESRRS